MPDIRVTRRDFLKAMGMSAALGAVHGCGTPAPSGEPTEAPGVTPGATEAPPPTVVPTPAQGPKYGGTLKVISVQDYASLDPHKTLAANDQNMFDGLFNGLTQLNQMQEGTPSLAHSWDVSDDGTEYTFYLREGVNFHNSREMTADDVKFSFDRIRDPDTASYWGTQIPEMSDVEVVDQYTVKCYLSSPVAYFLGFLAKWKIVAQENMDDIATSAIGTGPFKLKEYVLGDHLSMVRFDDYFEEGLPYLDEVVLHTIMDVTAAYTAWGAGEFDVYWKLQLRWHGEVEESADQYLIVSAADPYNEKVTLHFDCVTPEGLFVDKRARQAIAYAIDKTALANTAYFGRANPNPYSIVMSEDNPFFNAEGLTKYEYDLDEAARLLEEAGAKPGDTWEYNAYAGDPEGVNMGIVMKDALAEIGYNLDIVQSEVGVWVNKFYNVPAPNIISWNGNLPSPEPSDTFQLYLPGTHPGFWEPSDEIAELMTEGRASMDVDARKDMYHEIETVLNDELPDVYPVHRMLPSAAWNYVKGEWQETVIAQHYKETWLDT